MKFLKFLLFGCITGLVISLIYTYKKELGIESESNTNTGFNPDLTASLLIAAHINDDLVNKVSALNADLINVKSASSMSFIAGEAIGAEKTVVVSNGKVYIFNPNNPAHINFPVGFVLDAVTENQPIDVKFAGKVIVTSALTINSKYFVSGTGSLTSTVPTSGILQSVGFAISPTELLLDFSKKINL